MDLIKTTDNNADEFINPNVYPELNEYINFIKQHKDYPFIIKYGNDVLLFKNDKDILCYNQKYKLSPEHYKLYFTDYVLNNVNIKKGVMKTVLKTNQNNLNIKFISNNNIPNIRGVDSFQSTNVIIAQGIDISHKTFKDTLTFDTGATFSSIDVKYLEELKHLIIGYTELILGDDITKIASPVVVLYFGIHSFLNKTQFLDDDYKYKLIPICIGPGSGILGMDIIQYLDITINNLKLTYQINPDYLLYTKEYKNLDNVLGDIETRDRQPTSDPLRAEKI